MERSALYSTWCAIELHYVQLQDNKHSNARAAARKTQTNLVTTTMYSITALSPVYLLKQRAQAASYRNLISRQSRINIFMVQLTFKLVNLLTLVVNN